MFVLHVAATPSRLSTPFPAGVRVSRVPLEKPSARARAAGPDAALMHGGALERIADVE